MSADNYVIVRKFADDDYRWQTFSASDDEYDPSDPEDYKQDKSDSVFLEGGSRNWVHGRFKTEQDAIVNAYEELCVIEYGIESDVSESYVPGKSVNRTGKELDYYIFPRGEQCHYCQKPGDINNNFVCFLRGVRIEVCNGCMVPSWQEKQKGDENGL